MRFDNAAIQAQLDRGFKTMGGDRGFAVVDFVQRKAEGGTAVRFAVGRKMGEHWSMVGVLEHLPEGNSGALGVRFSD